MGAGELQPDVNVFHDHLIMGSTEADEPSTEQSEADAFREKIRSIQFLGRGKANRYQKIRDAQKRQIEREGGQFT